MTAYILMIAVIEEESVAAKSLISQERTKGGEQRAPLPLLWRSRPPSGNSVNDIWVIGAEAAAESTDSSAQVIKKKKKKNASGEFVCRAPESQTPDVCLRDSCPCDAWLFLQQEEEGGKGKKECVNKPSSKEDPAAASLKRRVSVFLCQTVAAAASETENHSLLLG